VTDPQQQLREALERFDLSGAAKPAPFRNLTVK
jgi:hypothetical protein